MARKSKSPPLTDEQRVQIRDLAMQGHPRDAIADHLSLPLKQVNGSISQMQHKGILPKVLPALSGSSETAASQVPPAEPGTQQQPASVTDDFSDGRPVVGGAEDGWAPSGPEVRYNVSRVSPSDGLLGTHFGSFTQQDLGEIYGSGSYQIERFEAGKTIPHKYNVKISETFGPPKYPTTGGGGGRRRDLPAAGRPVRPWNTEDDGSPRPWSRTHPYYRQFYQQQQAHGQRGDDGGYAALARQASASESTMSEVVRQMGQNQREVLSQMKGPQNEMGQFFQNQQHMLAQQMEEDRRNRETQRKEEEAKWERRRQEQESSWERRQKEEQTRHEREMARIKAEADARLKEKEAVDARERTREEERQKFLLDLQDKRLEVLQAEAKISQQRVEGELTRSRDEMKTLTDRTSKEIAETREGVAAQMDHEREILDRENNLRLKSMETEHELRRENLNMQKEMMETQGSDAFFSMLNNVVKELAKGLEKVVDLKKIQSMSPEEHAARAAATPTVPTRRGAVAGTPQAPIQVPTPTVPTAGGHSQVEAPVEDEIPQENIESRIEEMIAGEAQNPFFKRVFKEWSMHVKNGNDATLFANLYLEYMRDPEDDKTRKACAAFATFMGTRKWADMMEILKPNLDPEVVEIFQSPYAEEFYESFRAMVLEQIKEYWEQFLDSRKKQRAAGPSPEASEKQPEAKPEPVPTRGDPA